MASCADRLDPIPDRRIKAIMSNEALERYSYYSSRAVLALYLNTRLGFSEAESISLFSFYVAACYISPLLGGYIGDVLWGKFRTMVVFNGIYMAGLLTIGLTALRDSRAGAAVGLALMALGTGGIKPCAGPFGADQLPPARPGDAGADAAAARFWLLWYFCINLGSILSYVVAPAVRQAAGYSAVYLVSLGALAVSLGVLLLPRARYVYVPPSGVSVWATIASVLAAAARGGGGGGGGAAASAGGGDGRHRLEDEGEEGGGVGEGEEGVDAGAGAGASTAAATRSAGPQLSAVPPPPPPPSPPQQQRRLESTPLLTASKAGGSVGGGGGSSGAAGAAGASAAAWRAADSELSSAGAAAIARSASFSKSGKLARRQQARHSRGGWWYRCAPCLDLERARGRVPDADLAGVSAFLGLVPLFSCLCVFWLLYDQQDSLWTLQRTHMDLCLAPGARWGCIAPEAFGVVNPLLVLLGVPFMDRVALPALRWAGVEPTPLRRMAFGMQAAALSFGCTALVQWRIDTAGEGAAPVLLQLPQFLVMNTAELCVSATGLEFAASQSPPSMKSTVMALFFLTTFVGNTVNGLVYPLLAAALSPLQRLLLLTGVMSAAGCVFAWLAWRYQPVDRRAWEPPPQQLLLPRGGGGGGGGSARDSESDVELVAK